MKKKQHCHQDPKQGDIKSEPDIALSELHQEDLKTRLGMTMKQQDVIGQGITQQTSGAASRPIIPHEVIESKPVPRPIPTSRSMTGFRTQAWQQRQQNHHPRVITDVMKERMLQEMEKSKKKWKEQTRVERVKWHEERKRQRVEQKERQKMEREERQRVQKMETEQAMGKELRVAQLSLLEWSISANAIRLAGTPSATAICHGADILEIGGSRNTNVQPTGTHHIIDLTTESDSDVEVVNSAVTGNAKGEGTLDFTKIEAIYNVLRTFRSS